MSRSEKIKKLGNAIRRYRGRYHPETKVWIRHPDPKAKRLIIRWLEELDLDVTKSMKAIDGFKTLKKCNEWMKKITESPYYAD